MNYITLFLNILNILYITFSLVFYISITKKFIRSIILYLLILYCIKKIGSIIAIPFGLYYEKKRLSVIFFPILIFLLLYSFLPHKELRFIFYTIPIFNTISAVGIWRIFNNFRKKIIFNFLFIFIIISLVISFFISLSFLYISSYNYPGGYALQKLHKLEENHFKNPYIHLDVFSCMTGITRFCEKKNARYSKEENITNFRNFDYLLNENKIIEGFEVIGEEIAFDGINFLNLKNFIKLKPKIYIHKKKYIY
jgi:alpha-1,6-mannosyltransferase